MTYNFDPDRWYDNERKALDARLQNGDIGENEFQAHSEALQLRYEQMLERLDGTYRIPGVSAAGALGPATREKRST